MRCPPKALAAIVLPMLLIAGCTQLSADDRALLQNAQKSASDAAAAAQQAADAANRAAAASQQSASDAKAAAERADRMFQRSQRKVSPR
ncbi:MAG TPA: alanine-zipper protein [Alphaproteobacteria bacterium]|nr:alanine-zipper protein [Alphaproteobacteria bacterium]